MVKKKEKTKRPSKKELEFLAYALPWELFDLLPKKDRDKDKLIKNIIILWERIRGR